MSIALSIVAIFLLIVLSAFFNGSETSLTAASRARMHALEEDGNASAALVNRVLSRPEKMIGTVLLGNTLVDVLAAALASNVAVHLYGEVGVAYATALITILIVIFAAVLPKTYALAYADRVALLVAPPMRGLIYVLTPFTKAIEYVVRNLLKLTPGKADDEANILSAMLAKRLGAKKALCLINRLSYVDLVEGGAIDIAISPQQSTVSALLSRVRRGDVVKVHSLRRGAAEAIEAVAHGDRENSRVIGRRLDEIKMPPGTTIGAIVRGDEVVIAHHDTVIQAEDHIILFIVDKQYTQDVEKLFQVGVRLF